MVRSFTCYAVALRDVAHRPHVRGVSEEDIEKPFDAEPATFARAGLVEPGGEIRM